MRAWIGLGGNHDDSLQILQHGLVLLNDHPSIACRRVSSWYRSDPWGVTEQAEFVNAVAEIETSLPAPDLLAALLQTEKELGRTREGARWGPRPVDLDLLTYEDLRLAGPELELPHPRMHLRAFVLIPLLEVEPGFDIPGLGPAAEALERLGPEAAASVRPLLIQTREHAT